MDQPIQPGLRPAKLTVLGPDDPRPPDIDRDVLERRLAMTVDLSPRHIEQLQDHFLQAILSQLKRGNNVRLCLGVQAYVVDGKPFIHDRDGQAGREVTYQELWDQISKFLKQLAGLHLRRSNFLRLRALIDDLILLASFTADFSLDDALSKA